MDGPAYVSVEDASSYLAGRPNSEHWTNATPEQQLGALKEASDRIDELPWRGLPLIQEQTRAWPRTGVDATSFNVVRRAVILEALAMVQPVSERQKLQAEGVTSYRIGSLSETYKGEVKKSAGAFNSASAFYILRPYLAMNGRVT